MSDPGCFFHGAEPVPVEYFRLCLECGHCFISAEEFMAAQRSANLITPRLDLTFCPLCSHDF